MRTSLDCVRGHWTITLPRSSKLLMSPLVCTNALKQQWKLKRWSVTPDSMWYRRGWSFAVSYTDRLLQNCYPGRVRVQTLDVRQHVISIGCAFVEMANSEVGIVLAAERDSSQTQCLGRLSSSIVSDMTFLLSGRLKSLMERG